MSPKEILALWDLAVRSHREFLAIVGFVPHDRLMLEVKFSDRLRDIDLDSPLRVGGY